MICLKRQKIVSRDSNGSTTTFRCLNDLCAASGQLVTEEECANCPSAVTRRKKKKCSEPVPCKDCLKKKQPQPAPQFPKLTLQAAAYANALKRWQAAGRPTRSQEEVKEIHEKYCAQCDWYDNGRCRGCGCKVSQGSFAITNKIKMATEHCPKDLW